MNVLILDVETTTSNNGNPFDQTNKLVCIGLKGGKAPEEIYYLDNPKLWEVQETINQAHLLVGFNIKFDLHWLRRVGIKFDWKRVWDCQLAEFILDNQTTPYNSLNDSCIKYGLSQKLDVVKTEYWDKEIDTDQIPRDVLSDYLRQDLTLTEQVYAKQQEQFKNDKRFALFKLQCLDLMVLEEIESNGFLFDTSAAAKQSEQIGEKLKEISRQLSAFTDGVPVNFDSSNHLSCLLYGGTIVLDDRIPVGTYKTGVKIGQTRYRVFIKEYVLPRLVEPLKGTAIHLKEGEIEQDAKYWSTDEKTLRSLKLTKKAKELVTLLREYSELEKLNSTYLIGFPKLMKEMHWKENEIHGNLNQCVVRTGRLSSSKPNLQNMDPDTKRLCISRYDS